MEQLTWKSVSELPPIKIDGKSELLLVADLYGDVWVGFYEVFESYIDDWETGLWYSSCPEQHNLSDIVRYWLPLSSLPKVPKINVDNQR